MSKHVRLISLLCLSTLGLYAQTLKLPNISLQETQTFAMVGVAEGQMAQLNVLNPTTPTTANANSTCSALLAFVDDTGKTVVSKTVSVPPGKSVSLVVDSQKDLNLAVGARDELRGTITIPPTAVTTLGAISSALCTLIPSLEVINTLTAMTQFVMVETTREANVGPITTPVPTPVTNP
jgi:hypothetical protein